MELLLQECRCLSRGTLKSARTVPCGTVCYGMRVPEYLDTANLGFDSWRSKDAVHLGVRFSTESSPNDVQSAEDCTGRVPKTRNLCVPEFPAIQPREHDEKPQHPPRGEHWPYANPVSTPLQDTTGSNDTEGEGFHHRSVISSIRLS